MITTIRDRIAGLPDQLRRVCEQLFFVDSVSGFTVPPAAMEGWIERQFGTLAAVREQTIIKIINRLTLEGALFNPLRARRPGESRVDDAALEAYIAQRLGAGDLFREPLRDTTADRFGRIRGRFCVSASNVAKCDGWHGVVIFDEPHPLHFDQARLCDYLAVAGRWLAAAHAQDQQAVYPFILWNCLPKSGATLVHGHMQIVLGRGMHYGRVESWRRAAEEYRRLAGASYFDALFAVHQALDLAIPTAGGLRGFAHLTPLRNREIVLLDHAARCDHTLDALEPLAIALYDVLRKLIDGQGMRAFNVAIALPPLEPAAADWSDVPVFARVVDRGDPLATSSDWGAIELFGSGCVVEDPFEVARKLLTAPPRAVQVIVTDDTLSVDLEDGRTIAVPIGWFPRLAYGTAHERANVQIAGAGFGLHWPDLDEDIGVEGLLLGKKSTESPASFARWLEQRRTQQQA